jgi:regulatory protein spx
VKKWFEMQQIPFEERNLFSAVLNENELKEMLAKSENGTEDIISTRSKIIKDQNLDVENMSVKELIMFIRENPSVLKRPIMVDERRIQVGYNEEEIRTFIPTSKRYPATKSNQK